MLCESTTKEDLLLYLNYNKYKLYWTNFLIGSLYAITRVSYIPIMISLMANLNSISFLCLVLVLGYSLKLKRLFFNDLKMMSWSLTLIMLMHSCHQYLQYVFIDKFQVDKKYFGETNFYMKFMEIFQRPGEMSLQSNPQVPVARILSPYILSDVFGHFLRVL